MVFHDSTVNLIITCKNCSEDKSRQGTWSNIFNYTRFCLSLHTLDKVWFLPLKVQCDLNCAEIKMNREQSLISPVLKYASSFNRFDYSLVYISVTSVCFLSYQATTVRRRTDVMYRMPSTVMLFLGNEQEMQAQVEHSHIMFPFQSFWWGIWTKAKIIRPTLAVCMGINSL